MGKTTFPPSLQPGCTNTILAVSPPSAPGLASFHCLAVRTAQPCYIVASSPTVRAPLLVSCRQLIVGVANATPIPGPYPFPLLLHQPISIHHSVCASSLRRSLDLRWCLASSAEARRIRAVMEELSKSFVDVLPESTGRATGRKHLESIASSAQRDNMLSRVCFLCRDVLPYQWMIPCGHVICRGCLHHLLQGIVRNGKRGEKGLGMCPEDNVKFTMCDVLRLEFNAKHLKTVRVHCPNVDYGCTHGKDFLPVNDHSQGHCSYHPTMRSCSRSDSIRHGFSCAGQQHAFWIFRNPEDATSDVDGTHVQLSLPEAAFIQAREEPVCAMESLLADFTARNEEQGDPAVMECFRGLADFITSLRLASGTPKVGATGEKLPEDPASPDEAAT